MLSCLQGGLRLEIDRERLSEICARYAVRELSLFGSVLRDDFGPKSDVDVLVDFEPGRAPSLFRFLDLQGELAVLFGRTVDLADARGLSPGLRDHILASRSIVHGSAG